MSRVSKIKISDINKIYFGSIYVFVSYATVNARNRKAATSILRAIGDNDGHGTQCVPENCFHLASIVAAYNGERSVAYNREHAREKMIVDGRPRFSFENGVIVDLTTPGRIIAKIEDASHQHLVAHLLKTASEKELRRMAA